MPASILRSTPSPERILTGLLLLAYLIFVLSLPAWPSQDGPVHLFYTQVLAGLLHKDATYARFFYIKHLLPPYALYYYLLLLLSRAVPLLLADRLVVCAYMVIFTTGFHALARALAPSSARGPDRVTLLATLLLLNWPLGMGFVNFCLSLALALWALAVWFRPVPVRKGARTLLFLLLVVAITLSHPVPLLLVLGVAALDLLTRAFRRQVQGQNTWRADALAFVLACTPLVYVRAFAAPHLLAQRTVEATPLQRAGSRFTGYFAGKSLSLLFGHSPGVALYRAALTITLLVAFAAGARAFAHSRRDRQLRHTDLFFTAAVLLFFALPWLPSDISGAYYFPERLVLVVWLFALLGAASFELSPRNPSAKAATWVTPLVLLFASGSAAALILSANAGLRPLAVQSRAWQDSPLVHSGELVLSLESNPLPPPKQILPSWNPHYWMVANIIRSRGAVLANAPWLDSSIIPLGATANLPASNIPAQIANSPGALTALLRKQPSLTRQLLGSADVVSFTPADVQPTGVVDPLLLSAGEVGKTLDLPENSRQG